MQAWHLGRIQRSLDPMHVAQWILCPVAQVWLQAVQQRLTVSCVPLWKVIHYDVACRQCVVNLVFLHSSCVLYAQDQAMQHRVCVVL